MAGRISVSCPECGKQYKMKEELAGSRVTCRECGHPFQTEPPVVADAADDPLGLGTDFDDTAMAAPAAPLSKLPPVAARNAPAKNVRRKPARKASSSDNRMTGWGITFSVIGIGAFLLPMFGIQFKIVAVFGPFWPFVAILAGLIGGTFLGIGLRRNAFLGLAAAFGVIGATFALFVFFVLAGVKRGGGVGGQQRPRFRQRIAERPVLPPFARQRALPPPNFPRENRPPMPQPPVPPNRGAAAPNPPALNQGRARPDDGSRPAPLDFNAPTKETPAPPLELEPVDEALPTVDFNAADLRPSAATGSLDGKAFIDHAPPGGVLVGFRFSIGRAWGGSIQGLQPVYQTGSERVAGQCHGQMVGIRHETELAKPGYAVAGLHIQSGLVVDAVRVVFARVADGHLDMNDIYESQWQGNDGGSRHDTGSDGLIACGVQGNFSGQIQQLQLLQHEAK